eukprot:TRINITY_DN2224_c0_g2_i1.p1 TRINITY_DN2224_c0_g2~~TRINITY_DN2224_c0_g2_i1.p1  ORF type:complete len:518 (-),score=108.09 TRINITY_DN2224_c0_g2_i1:167-1720(-)
MTRILVQRGSASSSSNASQNRANTASSTLISEEHIYENPNEVSEERTDNSSNLESHPQEDNSTETFTREYDSKLREEKDSSSMNAVGMFDLTNDNNNQGLKAEDDEAFLDDVTCYNQFGTSIESSQVVHSCTPAPPVPPPKPVLNPRRAPSAGSSNTRSASSRRSSWIVPSSRSSPTESRPSSPRSLGEEGYNSADEQSPRFGSYYDAERETQFEIDIRCAKGLEVKRMIADGNCLFRAVADQVYGDPELYDDTRQMCIDYMEKERDHFSQFITENFTTYCKRKRRDKVYGNNLEIQAMSEMYNRPIHIYSYSTEPINIFHGSYSTDFPPIRLSFHRGNHYNSLVDPHHLTIGAGLGFSSLHGKNIDKDQVKAVIKAQQDQQIENALLAEGRFYSDLELTQKELEQMVMEASRNEYKQQVGFQTSFTSANAEPSSSATRPSGEDFETFRDFGFAEDDVIPASVQRVASMGFDHVKVLEAHSIFGNDVEAMVCYLLETSASSPGGENIYRMKGKAAEN